MKKIIILLTITLATLNIAGQIRSLKIDKGNGDYEILPLNNNDQYFIRTEANAANNLVIKIYDSANNLLRKYPENSKIYPITQTIPVTDISLDKTEITLTDVGEQSTITATIEPSNATNQNLTWTYSGSSITINPNGTTCEITAIAEGNATVTVTTQDGNFTASCTITVETQTVDYSIEMIPVPAGTFYMGSPDGVVGSDNERPQHQVTLSDFSIGKYEVTQAQWQAVMGSNPSYFQHGDNYLVEKVSWNDIVGTSGATMTISGMTYYEDGFIYKLNQLTGKHYRLPTEAEWEYAARGGSHWTNYYIYSGSNNVGDVAWYQGNSFKHTYEVGTKSANQLGIHDMSGNVWEWVYDWYGTYTSTSQTNPTGQTFGSYRVFRGGCWYDYGSNCRVAYRSNYWPGYSYDNVGFRLVLVP